MSTKSGSKLQNMGSQTERIHFCFLPAPSLGEQSHLHRDLTGVIFPSSVPEVRGDAGRDAKPRPASPDGLHAEHTGHTGDLSRTSGTSGGST